MCQSQFPNSFPPHLPLLGSICLFFISALQLRYSNILLYSTYMCKYTVLVFLFLIYSTLWDFYTKDEFELGRVGDEETPEATKKQTKWLSNHVRGEPSSKGQQDRLSTSQNKWSTIWKSLGILRLPRLPLMKLKIVVSRMLDPWSIVKGQGPLIRARHLVLAHRCDRRWHSSTDTGHLSQDKYSSGV